MCLPRWKFLKCTCPCSLRMRYCSLRKSARARFRSTSWCCMLLIAYIMCKIKMIFLVSDKDNWVLQLQSCSFVQPTACFLTLSLPLKLICFRQEIRSATSSMTSVLKPLKFLFSHFGTLKSYFETIPEYDLKKCVNTLDHPASVCCRLVWCSADDTILLFCRSTWLTYCQC